MDWLVFIIIAILGAVIVETSQKHALNALKVQDYFMVRSVLVLLVITTLIPFIKLPNSVALYAIIITIALLVALALFLKHTAIKNMDLSLAKPLLSVHIIFVTLFAFLLLKEKPTFTQLTGITLIIIGIYVLNYKHKTKNNKSIFAPLKTVFKNKYQSLMIFSGMIFGITTTIERHIVSQKVDPVSYMFLAWFFVSIIYLITWCILNPVKKAKQTITNNWKLVIIPAIGVVVTYTFFLKALAIGEAGITSAVFRVDILLTTLAAGSLFKEKDMKRKLCACILIILGAATIILS